MRRANDIPPPLYFRVNVYMVKGMSSFFVKCAFGIPSAARYDAIENFICVFHVWMRARAKEMERERERERETVKKSTACSRTAYRCGILNRWDEHESPVSR